MWNLNAKQLNKSSRIDEEDLEELQSVIHINVESSKLNIGLFNMKEIERINICNRITNIIELKHFKVKIKHRKFQEKSTCHHPEYNDRNRQEVKIIFSFIISFTHFSYILFILFMSFRVSMSIHLEPLFACSYKTARLGCFLFAYSCIF